MTLVERGVEFDETDLLATVNGCTQASDLNRSIKDREMSKLSESVGPTLYPAMAAPNVYFF